MKNDTVINIKIDHKCKTKLTEKHAHKDYLNKFDIMLFNSICSAIIKLLNKNSINNTSNEFEEKDNFYDCVS